MVQTREGCCRRNLVQILPPATQCSAHEYKPYSSKLSRFLHHARGISRTLTLVTETTVEESTSMYKPTTMASTVRVAHGEKYVYMGVLPEG